MNEVVNEASNKELHIMQLYFFVEKNVTLRPDPIRPL
jgi:hypothetical protein